MLACPCSQEQGEFKPITDFYGKKNGPYFLWNNLQSCCMLLLLIGKRNHVTFNRVNNLSRQLQQLHQRRDENFLKLLTGDVGLSREDCVLEFIRHHCELIV